MLGGAMASKRPKGQHLVQLIEGLLLAADTPLSVRQLTHLFAPKSPLVTELKVALAELGSECEHRAYSLEQVAGGYRLRLRDELNPYLERMRRERPPSYSRALMETCAAIAYRQPLSRGDIENLRGVSLSPGILRTLLEREWVHVVGHRETPGRPALYATTQRFLADLGLRKLSDLPQLPELSGAEQDAQLPVALADSDEATTATVSGTQVTEDRPEPQLLIDDNDDTPVAEDVMPTAAKTEPPKWPVVTADFDQALLAEAVQSPDSVPLDDAEDTTGQASEAHQGEEPAIMPLPPLSLDPEVSTIAS